MTTNTLPDCWQDVQDVLDAGIDRLILHGPPGTGKTYAGLTIGNVAAGSFRLECTEEMTQADITGTWMPNGQGTWNWMTGKAVKAWEGDGFTGGRLVVDEIDKASGDVLALLLAMTDSPESCEWENPESGRKVRPRQGFSVVMTTNVEDLRELPQALLDRFPIRRRINTPHPNGLLVLPEDLRGPAAASADADKDRRFSLRAFMAFDTLRKSIGAERASKLVFGKHSASILDAIRVNGVSV
jgi:MoxR-like ATPase